MAAIYAIWNNVSEKVYIGGTKDPEKRRKAHWKALRGGYHKNRHLQSAWNTYGADAFEFHILFEFPGNRYNDEECAAFDSMVEAFGRDRVYTFRRGGDNPLNNPEVREYHKAAAIAWAQVPENRELMKEAGRKRAADPAWRQSNKEAMQKRAQDPKWLADNKARGQARASSFWAYPPDGSEPLFWTRGQNEFARQYEVNQGSLNNALSGKTKTAKGWRFARAAADNSAN